MAMITTNTRGSSRLPLVLAAMLVAGVATMGCVDEPTMLVITSALVPQDATEGGGCAANPESETFVTSGTVDVASAASYTIALRLENVAPSSEEVGTTQAGGGGGGGGMQGGGFDNLDLEGNSVFVTNAIVEFDPQVDLAGVDLDGFNEPIGGPMVTPGGGSAAMFITLLTPFQLSQLASVIAPGQSALIVVDIQLAGHSTSETDFETNKFSFPITVCNGCLAIAQCSQEQADTLTSGCAGNRHGQDTPYCLSVVAEETGN